MYRAVKKFLPTSVVNVVSDITLKNVHIPLIYVDALEPKYEMAWKYLQRFDDKLGDYLEFGVSQGTSMACMNRVINKLELDKVRLIGFDSFEGMPSGAAEEDNGIWKPGQFACAIENTEKFLSNEKVDWSRTFLIKGWFEDTLNDKTTKQYGIRKASIVMIDCDIYSASKAALNYSLPMITDHCILFFDDWLDDISFGECRAYSEILNKQKNLQSTERWDLSRYEEDLLYH